MKRYLITLKILFLCLAVHTQPIDVDFARKTAERSLQQYDGITNCKLTLIKEAKAGGNPGYYVFKINTHQGYIIIAGDKRLLPVIGYSLNNPFSKEGEQPEEVKKMLRGVLKIIETKNFERFNKTEIFQRWEKLTSLSRSEDTITQVLPLLTTTWNQNCSYNTYCPADINGPCNHALAGCVAVSASQILNYWKYPDTAKGTHTYTHPNYGVLSTDFRPGYAWDSMPVDTGNPHVANLLSDVGIAINMNYGSSSSSAKMDDAIYAFKNYFKYSNNIGKFIMDLIEYTNYSSIVAYMKEELKKGHPLFVSGWTETFQSSHAYNIDGFKDQLFHHNWGWGGTSNGYYDIRYASFRSSKVYGNLIPKIYDTLNPFVDIQILEPEIEYFDSTHGLKNNISFYNIIENQYFSTGEKIYKFELQDTGFVMFQTSISPHLKGVLIDSFNPMNSIYGFDFTGLKERYYLSDTGTYYLVVDGIKNDSFRLTYSVPYTEPDLEIKYHKNFEVNPGEKNVNYSNTIVNYGQKTAYNIKIVFYLSQNDSLDQNDSCIKTFFIDSIQLNNPRLFDCDLHFPHISEGNYKLFVVIDPDSTINDPDRSNNIHMDEINITLTNFLYTKVIYLEDNVWDTCNTSQGHSYINKYYITNPEPPPLDPNEPWEPFVSWYQGFNEIVYAFRSPRTAHAVIEGYTDYPYHIHLFALNSPYVYEETYMTNYSTVGENFSMAYYNVHVYKGQYYYFTVEKTYGDSIEFMVKVNIPDTCPPKSKLSIAGDTLRCKTDDYIYLGDNFNGFNTRWYHEDTIFAYGRSIQPDIPGRYYAQNYDNNCLVNSDTVYIRILEKEKPDIIHYDGDRLRCEQPADKYEWFIDTMKLNDSTKSISATQTGYYSVRYWVGECPSAISDSIYINLTSVSTSVNNNSSQNELLAQPNPFSESSVLRLKYPLEGSAVIKITDILGNVVTRETINGNSFRFNPDEYNRKNNVYIIHWHEHGQEFNKKIICK
jgi:hypothetical protein